MKTQADRPPVLAFLGLFAALLTAALALAALSPSRGPSPEPTEPAAATRSSG